MSVEQLFDIAKLYTCAQAGHYRNNNFCYRCKQELPKQTIEENLFRQIEKLQKEIEELKKNK